jgi:hypothetical protein
MSYVTSGRLVLTLIAVAVAGVLLPGETLVAATHVGLLVGGIQVVKSLGA